eukprot:jgi/Chrzof1/14527/Cz09g06040.t1
MDFYLEDEWPYIQQRMSNKVIWAAAASATVYPVVALLTGRPALRSTAAVTVNAALAMACFAAVQEGFRGMRHGAHDALNSTAAGAVTGAGLVRLVVGPQYWHLGALTWGIACGATHVLNDTLQPSHLVKEWLAQAGLLDKPQPAISSSSQHSSSASEPHSQQEGSSRQQVVGPITADGIPYVEKLQFVKELREREVQELNARLEQEALQRQQQQQQQQPVTNATNRTTAMDAMQHKQQQPSQQRHPAAAVVSAAPSLSAASGREQTASGTTQPAAAGGVAVVEGRRWWWPWASAGSNSSSK